MIVPDYWAEARKQHRERGRQVTVRRFGWSTTSEADAHAQAEARAAEALERILSGEKLDRLEPKVAYNGATGVPIREEVLARHGEQVITRNAYGAHCLNSPNALFADIDFDTGHSVKQGLLAFAVLALVAAGAGGWQGSWPLTGGLLLASALFAGPLAGLVARWSLFARGGAEQVARKRLTNFLARNPAWAVRLYRTPAGYRVLATHQAFDPQDSQVQAFFSAVAADPLYVRMCLNQRCYRARLTAKPWRIGISGHMRPRPGIWPVAPERRAVRNAWIAQYEAGAAGYAACRYLDTLGSGLVHETIKPVVELHDRESGALRTDAELA